MLAPRTIDQTIGNLRKRPAVEAGLLRLATGPFFMQGAFNGADHCSGQTRNATIDGTDLEKVAKRRRLKMAVEADPKC
jgi:hypothetical protein